MIFINKQKIELGKFPDGTPLFKNFNTEKLFSDEEKLGGKRIQVVWRYENNEEMIYLFMLVNHIKNHALCTGRSFRYILYMPYIPNARMDRVKDTDDVFTLKYFCDFINSLKFDKIFVLDAHSNVSLALLNNVVDRKEFLSDYIKQAIIKCNPDVLFFPDEGSYKRYDEIVKNIVSSSLKTFDISFANKVRDWKTGKILSLNIVNEHVVKDKNILIIDDICSKGGTFYHSAKALKNLGAKNIFLYVTHCENTILEGDLIDSDLIKKVYTANTIFTKTHPLIDVISY